MVSDGSAPTRQARRSDPHRGSEASRREVGWSVKLGRLVTAHLPGGSTIAGYVYKSDDYHWMLVDQELNTHAIHKSCSLSFGPASYAQEPRHGELERLVAPYRDHVMRTQFHADPDSASST